MSLNFLHCPAGSPFWKLPQEMHKAVRTADCNTVCADTALKRQGGWVGKQLLETNGRLKASGLVMGAGLGSPLPLPTAYTPLT